MKKYLVIITLSLFYLNAFSQHTGATPWSNCFGINASCVYKGCSDVVIKAPSSSSIVVIIKKRGKVLKHAYVSAGGIHTIEITDGSYQAFFYYGKDWNNYKRMPSDECGHLYGGFDTGEHVTKDSFSVYGEVLTYTLYGVVGGNHQNTPSSLEEAF